MNITEEINDAIDKGLQKLNNDKLFETHRIFKEVNGKRENEVLQNIYDYSKANSYDRAIFTIGAGHRKSLLKKIKNYQISKAFSLNWTFYNDNPF
jgi:DNA-binding protein Fis